MDPKTNEGSENLNPAQADYENKFNNLSNAENQTPSKNSQNPSDANSLSEAESKTDNKNGLYKPTQKSSLKNNISKKGFLKKFGPSGSIIGVVLAIPFFGMINLSFLNILNIKEILVNWRNDTEASTIIRSRKLIAKKVAFNFSSEGKCNIKCKFGSISPLTKKTLETRAEKHGFKVEFTEKRIAGIKRYVIGSIQFPNNPDGTPQEPIKNSKDFNKALKNTKNFSSFRRIMNFKNSIFLSERFNGMLASKFKLDKRAKVTGKNKDAAVSSLRKSLGLDGQTWDQSNPNREVELDKKLPTLKERLNEVKGKITVSGSIGGVCGLYDVARVFTWAQKILKISTYAGYAFLFLNMADSIKKGVNPDPESVEVLGNMLVNTDAEKTLDDGSKNANYGKSATDSVGYQMAAYQFTPGTLNTKDAILGLSPSGGFWQFVSENLGKATAVLGAVGLTYKGLRVVCGLAYSPYSGLVECASEFGAGAITALFTGGTSLLGSLFVCAVKKAVAVGIGIAAFNFAFKKGMDFFISKYTPVIDERTAGSDAGNIIYMGTSAIMESTSALYGMKAGNREEIKQYALDTSETRREVLAADLYDASKTPFDPYNQYSFLGQIIRSSGFIGFVNSSLLGKFSTMGTVMRSSILSLFPKTYADTSAAITKSELFSKCGDQSLQAIGVSGDVFCNQSYVMSSSELNRENDDTVDYMLNNNHIDTNGSVISKEYQNYMTYCANRIDPLGETSSSIADSDLGGLDPGKAVSAVFNSAQDIFNNDRSLYGWQIGQYCVEDSTMLSNFRTYTMDFALNENFENYE